MNSTEKQLETPMKDGLREDAALAKWALIQLFRRQSGWEQTTGQADEANGMGFTQFDSVILTSFCRQFIDRGFLSRKQLEILHKRLPKYWKQIVEELSPEFRELLVAGRFIPPSITMPEPIVDSPQSPGWPDAPPTTHPCSVSMGNNPDIF